MWRVALTWGLCAKGFVAVMCSDVYTCTRTDPQNVAIDNDNDDDQLANDDGVSLRHVIQMQNQYQLMVFLLLGSVCVHGCLSRSVDSVGTGRSVGRSVGVR